MTTFLDEEAFLRFTPKEMHEHLRRFDTFLVRVASEQPNVKSMLKNPFALFDASASFPIIHAVVLQKGSRWISFSGGISGMYRRREGHRFVAKDGDEQPLGMQPLLRLEVVTDPHLTDHGRDSVVKLLRGSDSERAEETARLTAIANLATKPAAVFSAPLPLMMKGTADSFKSQRFTLYQHIFGAGHEYPDDGSFYVGITSRDWKRRWAEHRAAILRGSRLKFHQEYARRLAEKQLTYVHHKVMAVFATLEEVQDYEEAVVAGHWDDERLLNMIPGGKAGVKYLREHSMLRKPGTITPKEIEGALEGWLRENPRKGVPAPWVAKSWEDADYALRVICGPEGRLTVEQVFRIRSLAAVGLSHELIAKQTGATSAQQVRRVLDGRTYSRVISDAPGDFTG